MKEDVDEQKFAGIHTFMRSPYVRLDELDGYDVGVLGVPLDYGASFREGAKCGPKEIREYSHWDKVDGASYVDLGTGDSLISNTLKIADLGDVDLTPTEAERNNVLITVAIKAVREKAFPLVLGGDHSITYPSFIGCKTGSDQSKKPMGLLVFDGHPDVEKGYMQMPRVWHGNFLRQLIEEGHVEGENVVLVGPRGLIPQKWIDYMKQKKIKHISTPEIRKIGLEQAVQNIIERLRDRCVSVYLSFDIDCIDPADAPGTGTPAWGGLRAHETISMIRQLKPLPIVGADITEVSPPLDPSGRTIVVACDLLWNLLSFTIK